MHGKTVSAILLVLLVLAVLISASSIQQVKASETIYIRADGSIDPPTAPIQRNGYFYTLTSDIYSDAHGIVIYRDNMTLDGAGYTLQGTGIGWGVALEDTYNVTVKNMKIKSFSNGLALGCSDSYLIGNSITGNTQFGIASIFAPNNNYSGNNIGGNTWNLGVFARSVENVGDLVQWMDPSNLIDGKPVYYIVNQANLLITPVTHSQVGFLALVNCENVTVKDLFLTGNCPGLLVANTTYSRIESNLINSTRSGIRIYSSTHNTICNNNITNNKWQCIMLYSSSDNTIYDNYLADTFDIVGGVPFGQGLTFDYSSNNTIFWNTIANNHCGVRHIASNNTVYQNNFLNNTYQAYDDSWDDASILPSLDIWDRGYPAGGNYWSDYNGTDLFNGPFQNQTGSDGIGDTPYIIDENNTDHYPLMNPWNSDSIETDLNQDGRVNILDITIVAAAYNTKAGDPKWNALADLDKNGTINIIDVTMVAKDYGKTA